MKEGAESLGWSFERVVRNADPATYSPETAAYMGFGDISGSKMSTAKTFLVDAADAGAEILVRTAAQRILLEGGRAAGVEARYEDPESGRAAAVTVRAPQVVVACGSLESPALLLRSQIGGPAVGENLRLHPCTAMFGYYVEDQRSWWGAPHTGVVDEFADTGDGWGFLIETAQYTTGIGASALPFTSAEAHKAAMEQYAPRRDHDRPAARPRRRAGDDRRGRPGDALLRASPTRSTSPTPGSASTPRRGSTRPRGRSRSAPWRPGRRPGGAATTSRQFIARAQRAPLGFGGHRLFSAHQMGSCRMGNDPRDERRRALGRAPRHPRGLDRRRQRLPDLLRHQPDDLDNGPCAPHRGGDLRRRARIRGSGPGGHHQPRKEPDQMATTAEVQTREKLYIGGEWVDPQGSETIEVINPSTEEVMGTIPAGTAEDVDRAVARGPRCLRRMGRRRAARSAPPTWRRSPPGWASARRRSRRRSRRSWGCR